MTNIFIFLPARLATCYMRCLKLTKKIFCLPESNDRDTDAARGYIAFQRPVLGLPSDQSGLDHASDYIMAGPAIGPGHEYI